MLPSLDTVCPLLSLFLNTPVHDSCRRSYEEASLDPLSFQAKKTKVERILMRPCSVRLTRFPAHLKCHY